MEKPTRPGRDSFKAFKTLQTRWIDNDIYGHMNNVVHYSLFDTAVNSWLIDAGLLDIAQGETTYLVVETGCKYFAEMAFPDTITAGIRISHIGRSSVKYEIALFRNEDNLASAKGFFVHVQVTRTNHQPARLTDAQKTALAQILA